jgi:hypothetical protein
VAEGISLILHGYTPPEPASAPVLGQNAEILDDTTVKELLDSAHAKCCGEIRARPVSDTGGR